MQHAADLPGVMPLTEALSVGGAWYLRRPQASGAHPRHKVNIDLRGFAGSFLVSLIQSLFATNVLYIQMTAQTCHDDYFCTSYSPRPNCKL